MHQRVLHVLAYASDQVNVVDKQCFEKALRDVSLVGHEFSEDLLRKLLVFLAGYDHPYWLASTAIGRFLRGR